MGATTLVGRCMFAFVFLASSLNKLQTLSDPIAGAATLASIAPRLAAPSGPALGSSLLRDIGSGLHDAVLVKPG